MGEGETKVAEWAIPVFGEEVAKDPNISKYDTAEKFLEGHRSAVERVGKSIVIPTEKSTPDEIKAFHSKLGVPESSDKYVIKAPDKLHPEAAKNLPVIEKSFREFVHKHNLTQKQAESIFPEYLSIYSRGIAQQEEATKTRALEAMTALKSEWGAESENNLALANEAANKLLTPEMAAQVKDNPSWIKFFHKLGKGLSEDMVKNITGTGSTGPQTEKQKALTAIEAIKQDGASGDPKDPYHLPNHPKHWERVQEVQKLYDTAYAA